MRVLCDGIMALSIAAIPALQKQLFDLFNLETINRQSLTI